MTERISLIESARELNALLFERLAYGRRLPDNDKFNGKAYEGTISDDVLIENIIRRFIIALQEPVTPVPIINRDMILACREIFHFLPIAGDLLEKIETKIDGMLSSCPHTRVRKGDNSVAYFLSKARTLPGFSCLALSVRDLIVRYHVPQHRPERPSSGNRVIPAALAVCTVIDVNVKHFNLRPGDIMNLDKYMKRDTKPLTDSTKQTYVAVQKKIVDATRDLYRQIGYGSPTLLFESESRELAREEERKRKVVDVQFPHISEPDVLKPDCIGKILTYRRPLTIQTSDDFNEISWLQFPTMTFVFGSKTQDLSRLKMSNYEKKEKRIKMAVTPDLLLKEETIYIPLPPEICAVIDAQIDYRSKFGAVLPNDRLLTIQAGTGFYPIDIYEVKRHYKALSLKLGTTIDERRLYKSHQAFFVDRAGLNAVISDRISNRKHPLSLVARLYTMSSLRDLREKHYTTFQRVSGMLGIKITSSPLIIADELYIMLGGKRAPGREVMEATFEYFRQMRPFDFDMSSKWLWFVNNYCGAARASEATSLNTKSPDFDLGLIKFTVRDTGLRRNTTKIVPFIKFTRDEYMQHLNLRDEYLRMMRLIDNGALFFRVGERGIVLPVDGNFMNDFYHTVAVSMGVKTFTSHAIRYQAQSDVTERGLSFQYSNCLLSHYPAYDEIFNPYSDVSYQDFAKEYSAVMESLLTEYLR